MKKYEEAPDDVAAPTEAMVEEKRTSFTNHNDYKAKTGTVSKYLLRGQDNALGTQTLLNLTGLKTARELQQTIETERKHGIPILTKPGSDGGYFLPSEDPAAAIQECRRFVHFMRKKGLGCLRSMRPAEKLLADLQREAGGQERMVL